mmetsp:Transcript_21866/g.68696  ORF Transcript_21866/g.68696 Transcript_21866/m.68696 type:complete len:564 (-) Transcript_21866:136-1827(-)
MLFSLGVAEPAGADSVRRRLSVGAAVPTDEWPELSRPAWASGCSLCDAFAGPEGFFSVAADCTADEEMPRCLATLISSLGMSRPASFFRHGLPVGAHDRMPGVIVGRRTAANVTGAYAFDPGYLPGARGGLPNELPACHDENAHALSRMRFTEQVCRTTAPSPIVALLRQNSSLNCRFSGLEAMAQQQQAFLHLPGSGCARTSATLNRVSLRYGFEDVLGVVYTNPEHGRIATDLAMWLRKLSGRDIGLVRMGVTSGSAAHANATCKCEAVGPASCFFGTSCTEAAPVLRMPELEVAPIRPSGAPGTFCVPHHCDQPNNPSCCPTACRAQEGELGNAQKKELGHTQRPRWHGVFMHIPKTGGSSLECASREWEMAGIWTNMGHALFPSVERCAARCSENFVDASGSKPPSITPALIMTVRNPYSFWWSLYGYVKASLDGRGESAALYFLQATNATACLVTFGTFLRHMRSHGAHMAQTAHIHRICGAPCLYHFLVHTETLDADWLALLGQLRLPLKPLPHVNVVDGSARRTHQLAAHYTPELARIVQEMELLLFDHFGYSRDL